MANRLSPFGSDPTVSPDLELAGFYQQDAANRIEQNRVAQRKAYDSSIAGKYGISDLSGATKGKTDTELYKTAVDLVNKRRGAATPPAPAPTPVTPPKVTTPKPAAKATSTKTASRKATTTRRTRPRTTTVRPPAPPKIVYPSSKAAILRNV